MRATAIAAILFAATIARADTELSMPDVQALAKAQQWTELLDRAERVKPSARTADWSRLVTDAATHVVQQIEAASTSGMRAASDLVDVVPRAEHTYPFLVGDAAYLGAKAKALQSLVPACVHAAEYGCSGFATALAAGITKFPPGTAKAIAQVVGGEAESLAEGVHFWALAVDDDKSTCTDPILSRSVVLALSESSVPRQVADARRAAATCYATIETALLDELVSSSDGATYLKNACPVLKTHGAMTISKKKKCP
ncbi:MAG TPA: hypothetical protein VGG28_20530 [Kofleriaceae bacterium]|jgi:hypothetical protein